MKTCLLHVYPNLIALCMYYAPKECTLTNYVLETTSVACATGPSVTKSSTDSSFQNLVFGNLFEISVAEIT
jgi:hypothetical protein